MARIYSADSAAPVAEAWSLIAEPARWPEWSPHVRGAWGLGSPEVEQGRTGAARLLWTVPVPARITEKVDGSSWTWRVGPMTLVHAVLPLPDGCRISTSIAAPGPLEGVLAATYGPVVQALMKRLATVAAQSAARSSSGVATSTSAPASSSSSRVP